MVQTPSISVIVLNYNGTDWIERCLGSLLTQTIFSQCEIIVADNASSDGSGALAAKILAAWPNGRYVDNGSNLGYCEGNNRAAEGAAGEYLFFLNNDTWLQPDCLEKLLTAVREQRATAGTPYVMEYETQDHQWLGATGFDLFGLPSMARPYQGIRELFMPPGCSFLIRRDAFVRLGRFDQVLFMYADELDLSWRVWISGGRAIGVADARLHHRGAVQVNPQGRKTVVEFRTSDKKRFYANRNVLLVTLKNVQFLLFFLAIFQVLYLGIECMAMAVVTRRWSFFRKTYLDALSSCWGARRHILNERKRLRGIRQRGDWFMLRFLRWRFNRWDELERIWMYGFPKITPK
jgi:GT2 family glycosyltransferase